jgi:hypothetical protein
MVAGGAERAYGDEYYDGTCLANRKDSEQRNFGALIVVLSGAMCGIGFRVLCVRRVRS